eukprot:TRINITY_DN1179_c0_g1::TRINITY_DN1179_c0_g1_i1::g.17236::m.17236 TRINITY_DN1179_c0_g1::TRINITY_DN1179_c0_g1_i1::g.17236  ORF type:complete len:125 (+),score=13.45 TRINITY_DN1179_c0_g1_i1:36-377(+)
MSNLGSWLLPSANSVVRYSIASIRTFASKPAKGAKTVAVAEEKVTKIRPLKQGTWQYWRQKRYLDRVPRKMNDQLIDGQFMRMGALAGKVNRFLKKYREHAWRLPRVSGASGR